MRGSVLRHARSIGANESGSNFGTGWAVGWVVWSSNPCKLLKELVGASGFEPPTSWSRTLGQPFCRVLYRYADFLYSPSSACVFSGLAAVCFALACTQLATLVARKGQEKGKVFEAPELAADHLSDPFGLGVPIVLKKLTNPGALILN